MAEVLDMSVLEELMSFADDGDPELLVDLVHMFLEDGPTKVKGVIDGLAAGDFDKAERAAHSLKGSSGNLGARRLQDVCERLQNSTRHHQLQESQQMVDELSSSYAEAEGALRKVLSDFSS